MRRIGCMLAVSAVIVASALAAVAQSESLGDYARAVRQEKRLPAKKFYTNDNLPTNTTISVVGPASVSSEDQPAAKPQDQKQRPDQKEIKTAETKSQPDEQGRENQISEQKKKVADLEHELDLLQREYKLRVAEYYGDAGSDLRDPKKWADEDAKHHADVADKQKQLDEAKTKLEEMQEQARKAGVQDSASE